MATPARRPAIRIAITGTDEAYPLVSDIQGFVRDVNLLYEIARLALDERHNSFASWGHVARHNGRPLRRIERLRVQHLRVQSPLDWHSLLPLIPGAALPVAVFTSTLVRLADERARNQPDVQPVRDAQADDIRATTQQRLEAIARENALAERQGELLQAQARYQDELARRTYVETDLLLRTALERLNPMHEVPPLDWDNTQRQLEHRGALDAYESVRRRLSHSAVHIADIQLDLVDGFEDDEG